MSWAARGTPVTSRSRRTLALPSTAIFELREHCLRQIEERKAAGQEWQEMDLVFTRSDGGRWTGQWGRISSTAY